MKLGWRIGWPTCTAGCIAVRTVQPSRRVYIEKADGRKRPLGIAALEDKIVQCAVVTILNQIYEEDFLERWNEDKRRLAKFRLPYLRGETSRAV